ncbi:MAG: methyltransferase domain-containing protein [Alphaproteobacteria bacterium]|nr:methyltransferase domain-containing protein [Alphaproteobacteria bacterium]
MWSDVVDLRDFYRTGLGLVARRMIQSRIRELWPDVTGAAVLGLGYATPFLEPFLGEAQRAIAIMPAAQGVVRWPGADPNLVALGDECELPLPDVSIDRVLLVHVVENADAIRPMLREVWRVLAGGGRLLAVVANRRSIWARLERTPFSVGQPYSRFQLNRLLREAMFAPVRSTSALYVVPSRSRMLLGAADAFENIGRRWFPHFGGVVLVEATKQIYVADLRPVRQRRRVAIAAPRRAAAILEEGGTGAATPLGAADPPLPARGRRAAPPGRPKTKGA